MTEPDSPGPFRRLGGAEGAGPRKGSLGVDAQGGQQRLAVVACRGGECLRWAPAWLESAGFEVLVVKDGGQIRSVLERSRPSVLIVDAALRNGSRGFLLQSLAPESRGAGIPLLALCKNDRWARKALQMGADEVVRRPFNWDLMSRRAEAVVDSACLKAQAETLRSELEQARWEVREARRKIRRTAMTDRMTALPNRETFGKLLAKALASGARPAVFFLDLDRFAAVNEAFGREAGNKLLRETAVRLWDFLGSAQPARKPGAGPAAAVLGALGGDQFVVMLTNAGEVPSLRRLAEELLEELAHPFQAGGESVFLSASLGAAISPENGRNAETLFHRAENAMVEAKSRGGGQVRFFEESVVRSGGLVLTMDRMLREAFEGGQLELHYQPMVDLSSGRVVGAEALLRWSHPERGFVPPLEFIPIAEETGLMVSLGAWVLETACRQLRAWFDEGLPQLRMAVNIAVCQLRRGDLAEVVRSCLQRNQLEPELLELELSERGVMRHDRDVLRQLKDLKEMGVGLSIDDFGTGDSAISWLRSLPVDMLKIDRSFIRGVLEDSGDADIASVIVAIGQRLRMQVTAEGVEREKQLEYLRGWGCQRYQGFLFSPAVTGNEFRALVADRVGRAEAAGTAGGTG